MDHSPPTLKQLEASLEAYFRKSVRRKLGGLVIKMAPTEKGLPDRLVLLPGGRMFLVELKAGGGRLSAAQVFWHERAAGIGVEVHVLEGWGQVAEWCAARMSELEEPDSELVAKRHPEYQKGYRAGYRFGILKSERQS